MNKKFYVYYIREIIQIDWNHFSQINLALG